MPNPIRQPLRHRLYLPVDTLWILQAEMQTISANLDDFREYFDWRKFNIGLTPLQLTVVKSIIENLY